MRCYTLCFISLVSLCFGACGGGGSSDSPSSGSSPAPTPTPVPVTVSQTLHTTVQIGPANADYGTLSYTAIGSAFVGYSVQNGFNNPPTYDLYTAAQTSDTTFNAPALVALGTMQINKGGGILGSFFHSSASTIWLSAESKSQLNIYKSTDSGASWGLNNHYLVTDRDQAFLHSRWYDEGSGNLSIVFGYEYFNPVTNSAPLISFVNYSGGTWDGAITQTSLSDDPVSVIKSGSHWYVPEGGFAISTDNGANFSHDWGGGGDYLTKIGSTLYAISFSGLKKSTDSGQTWTQVSSENFNNAVLAGNSNVLVVVTGKNSDHLSYRASADGGATWTAAADIVDVSASGYEISNVEVLAASNGRIGIVYSVQAAAPFYGPGATGHGVYFTEFY